MFIIKDWAGNVLNYKGNFELPCFAVPMEFTFQEQAFEWIDENLGEDALENLYVDEVN